MPPHDFLRDQFFSRTLQATVQRASIYDPDSVELGRTNFRLRLRECLEHVVGRYGRPQSDTEHVAAIQALADEISEKCGSALRGGRFRIGPAQKALNLSLKYHWAAGWIPEPPHCPLAAVIIGLLPAKIRCNWTDLDNIDGCRRLIDAASAKAGDLSLSHGELREYQNAFRPLQPSDSVESEMTWGLAPLGDRERRDLLELVEDRVGRRATLVTNQLPVDHWHEMIGDPTFGDVILDRLVHHAHRLTLTGGSLRRMPTPESPTD